MYIIFYKKIYKIYYFKSFSTSECKVDEFQCVSDKSCIESYKKCDGVNHCRDNSDEQDCPSLGKLILKSIPI